FVAREPEYQAEWAERCRRFAAALAGLVGGEAILIPRETTGRVPRVEVVFTPPARAAQISRDPPHPIPPIHLTHPPFGPARLTPVGPSGGREDIVAAGMRRRLGH